LEYNKSKEGKDLSLFFSSLFLFFDNCKFRIQEIKNSSHFIVSKFYITSFLLYSMLNHRLLTKFTDAESFVKEAVEFIQKHVKKKKVFMALSGGIDSSAAYLLLKRAQVNVLPVFIDHGLMRIIRGKEESEQIKEMFPDVMIVDIRNEFLPQIFGEGDAEAKRKLFKKAYSSTFDKIIKDASCDLLVDGTILPDLEESFGVGMDHLKETMSFEEETALREAQKGKGFVKSQHNVEITYDVEATVQPVASLTKNQVRSVLEYLDMPQHWVYRKAFPGPALAARIIGPVTAEKLAFQKKIHDLVETIVDKYYLRKHGKAMIINEKGEQEPFQVFAATFEDVAKSEVTGLRDGLRTYDSPKIVSGDWNFDKLVKEAREIEGFNRVFYHLGGKESGTFDAVIRSINSIDARTATITKLPIELLNDLKDKLLEIAEVKNVYFDVTEKPPATIEYV
jgi:GMP synthase (glutamine-hydrolysing)